jgi:hypothetical protein
VFLPELHDQERGPLFYIAGYVLSKLRKKSANKKNDELQVILQNMICPGLEKAYIEARSRGGQVTPCKDLVQILGVVEHIIFRQFIEKQISVVKSILSDKLCFGNTYYHTLWKLVILIWTAHGRPTKSKLVFRRQKLDFHTFSK